MVHQATSTEGVCKENALRNGVTGLVNSIVAHVDEEEPPFALPDQNQASVYSSFFNRRVKSCIVK